MKQEIEIQIRRTKMNDLCELNAILNEVISSSSAYLSSRSKSIEDTKLWFDQHNSEITYFSLSALHENTFIGWASLSPYKDIEGYKETAEVSIYIKSEYRGKGVAVQLMKELESEAIRRNFNCLFSAITSDNVASISLHLKCGYYVVGTLKKCAVKNEKIYDVMFMSKIINR